MTMEKQIYHSDSDFTFYEKCSGKKRKYMGSYDYMGMRVSFSATDQYPLDPNVPATQIQYRYRGTISILDPRGSGEVLRLQGADADYALKKLIAFQPISGYFVQILANIWTSTMILRLYIQFHLTEIYAVRQNGLRIIIHEISHCS